MDYTAFFFDPDAIAGGEDLLAAVMR